ncbi:hypothetical protein Bca52824_003248 [Brassica carinata]|uniref:Uncharacterized protein n=1 Tax=Brassica carinata TaxID=52824 RepID=A0A8X7WPX7_BRACI|nr:hypothetical protein Bca52824_003248 [Brassica carinata]
MSTLHASTEMPNPSDVLLLLQHQPLLSELVYAKTIYGNPDEDLHVRSYIHYFDPVKEDDVIVRDKALPMEFRKECFVVGMSHLLGRFLGAV